MKSVKSVASILFALILAASAAGCGGSPVESVPEGPSSQPSESLSVSNEPEVPSYLNLDSDLPVVKEGETVSMTMAVAQSSDYGDWKGSHFWNFVQQKMNIDVEVEQIFNRDEYVQLQFAADALPDVMIGMNLTTADQIRYGMMEKQLIPLTEYVNDTYMPNLTKIYAENPSWESMIKAPDGNIYSFGYMWAITNASQYPKRQINTKWLEGLNLEMPTTLDRLIEALRAFKTMGDDIVPMGGSYTTYNPCYILLNALGYVTNDSKGITPALRDGEAVIPAGDRERYGEFLKLMNQFYNEGLVSSEFYTLDEIGTRAIIAENKAGLINTDAFIDLPAVESFQQYITMPPLTSQYCEEPFVMINSPITTGGFVITKECEYPEAAIRFANYIYSDEGNNMAWVGAVRGSENLLEGWGGWYLDENYNRLDVDRVENPDLYPNAVEYLRKRVAGFNMGAIGRNLNEFNWRPEANGLPPRDMKEVYLANPTNGDFWFRASVIDNLMPYRTDEVYPYLTFFSEEENNRITELSTVINAHIQEASAKFVTGARPFSELDAYFDELDALGFQEYLGYYKTAYETYLKNMNS